MSHCLLDAPPIRGSNSGLVRSSSFVVPLSLCVALVATAQDDGHRPRARSLEVTASGATVRAGPSVHAPRRGTVRLGTRLAFEARVRGTGCPGGEWYQLADEQFICESLVALSTEEPAGDALPVLAPGEMLPRPYAFVSSDGTWAYARPTDYFRQDFTESLGRGFGLAIVERRSVSGVDFVRTLSGLWVPEDDVRFARGSELTGVDITDGTLDLAWVLRDGAQVREWNGHRAGARVVRRAGLREVLHVREVLPHGLLRLDEGVIATRDVARPELIEPPSEVIAGARWIDVSIASQTLVVYEGARPIFATLVSTGRPGPGHTTPVGTFHVWVKLAEDTMDDLEQIDQESNYAIEGVPWVQYFSEGIALHAAFWHDQFGHRHSHGCVNLSPRDAHRVFDMTSPSLPPGWDAILSTAASPGTVVHVH